MKYFSFIFLLLIFSNCSNGIQNKVSKLQLVKYSDSLYTKPIDSLYIYDSDIFFFNQQFSIDGYFEIRNKNLHSRGKLVNGSYWGKWKKYLVIDNVYYLDIEENYNNYGELHGEFKVYYPRELILERKYNFFNGKLLGKQYLYDNLGSLFKSFEVDSLGSYINDYIVFYSTRDTLFYVNLGINGTGYLKEYEDNRIYEEGHYLNGKKEGLFIQYNYINNDGEFELDYMDYMIFENNILKTTRRVFTSKIKS